ncbi:class I SAM-dependent methyltransferase [Candidatus Methylopumilus universalis]|nr:methyltransferase domain-containing protein [Candidatus Methylopumilus universalis]QDC99139.1 class I SAM-dependent methyltransferase [Candidatus Methylopumilus universalis]
MAHHNQLKFIELTINEFFSNSRHLKILEIGSYNVNGIDLRKFFLSPNYTGSDIIAGPNVDLICAGQKIRHPKNYYDITMSCECFEHNPHWKSTLANMIRMTKKNGFVIFTCATKGRIEHGTARSSPESSPGNWVRKIDYYKNLTSDDFPPSLLKEFSTFMFFSNNQSFDLYFIGIKKFRTNKIAIPEGLIKKINLIKEKKGVFFYLWKVPLLIASKTLSEESYQKFGISWYRLASKIKSFFSLYS